MSHFWLSFCDPKRPKGSQFIGASIVEAPHYMMASPVAWSEGCNPGGVVHITEIPMDELTQEKVHLVIQNMNRIMDMDELERLGFEPRRESEFDEGDESSFGDGDEPE